MKILVAGASGFIGRNLVRSLRTEGHEVRRLVRRAPASSDEVAWEPARRKLDPAAVETCDAIINLAGENIAAGRWTARRKVALHCSRVDATATLVAALPRTRHRPRVLLNASAVGCYGDRGDEILTETSPFGAGFLGELCRAWEGEANRAMELGVRVACLRFGVVLAADGGVLGRLQPVFRLGLGGRLGSGRQWLSWIHRDDAVAAITRALRDDQLAGPVNLVAPTPVRNAEFVAALGRRLRRPAVLPVPAWALRVALGSMADEALLASTRALPARLASVAGTFRHPTLATALAAG